MATLAELMAMNPRKQGESQLGYQQRMGKMAWTQGQTPENTTVIPLNPFAPQGYQEPDMTAGLRKGVAGLLSSFANGDDAKMLERAKGVPATIGAIPGAIGQMFSAYTDRPIDRDARKKAAAFTGPKTAAPQGPLTSYKDPRWDSIEAVAERDAGLPAGALAGIRLRGERSNEGQVSSAGAQSVYQFTPTTRGLIQKKYGFDPLSSDANKAKGAAVLLKEGMQRTGSMEGAVRQYIGGTDPRNYGSQTADYVARVMGDVQEAGGLASGFDPRMGQAAIGELNRGEAAALRPQSFVQDVSDRPELAAPEMEVATDFSKVDAALEKLKPHEMAEKDELETRRNGWFKGLGAALSNLEDGASLGKVLAAVGGGAMQGVGRANDELRARKDKFDDDMVRYNSAVANNEMTKAKSLQETMTHNAQTANQYALTNFKVATDQWNQEHDLTVQGDSVITTRRQGDKLITTRTPISGAVSAVFATRRAGVMESMASQANSASQNVAQLHNSLVVTAATQAAQMAQQDPEAGAGGMVLGTATVAGDVVSTGRVSAMFQGKDEAFKALQTDVVSSLGQMGLREGTTGYPEAYQRAMTERLTAAALTNPKFREQLMNAGGAATAARVAAQRNDQKQTTTVGPRGTTTRTEYR